MAIKHETGLARQQDQQGHEAPQSEQNSFARFVNANRDLFQRHTELTHDLRDEERGWRNSPTMERLAEERMKIAIAIAPRNLNVSGKVMRKFQERVRGDIFNFVFGDQETFDVLVGMELKHTDYLERMSPEIRDLSKKNAAGVTEARQSFHDARAPIVAEVRRSRDGLYQNIREFLLSDPSNIFSFRDFLLDKERGRDREAIRPLLMSLLQSESRVGEGGQSVLIEVVRKLSEELSQNPNQETIDEFSHSIKSPTLLSWLEFAADYARMTPQLVEDGNTDPMKKITAFLKTIDFQSAPQELRAVLVSFIASKYNKVLGEIKEALVKLGPPPNSRVLPPQRHPFLEMQMGDVRTNGKNGTKEADTETVSEKRDEKRERHPIAVLREEAGKLPEIRSVTNSELATVVEGEVNHLDPRDQGVQDDVNRMFDNLREDPYGLGTRRMDMGTMVVDGNNLALRSLNPEKRIGLELSHPESAKARIVYAIYRNGSGLSAIVLKGIYKEEDYNKQFS